MVFTSFAFLVFFSIVFVAYWQIPKHYQWVLLLAASYYFYFSWQPAYAGLLLLTTVVCYVTALLMEKYTRYKDRLLLLALLTNLGILFIFKYFNFFSYSLTSLFTFANVTISLPTFKLLLPVGISFYTFQSLSYVIDVYRGQEKAEKHFGIFALFVSFFPQLVAGPISRSSQLKPQFRQPHAFDYEQTVSGLKLFALGLFKKLVIADNLAVYVDTVFGSLHDYKGLSLLIAVFFFSWQIYCDFSGYTDMARGVARILGFNLIENFKAPYLATSVRDFWRRWHISLSSWFKDYLYIPLGGSRGGFWRTNFNNVAVFVVCGLWHGASWNFVLWGLFHGLFIALERFADQLFPHRFKFPPVIATLYAYSAITASWVLFRAETLSDAWYIYRYSLVGLKNFVSPMYIWASLNQIFETNKVEMAIIFACLVMIMSYEFISTRISISQLLKSQPLAIRWSLYTSIVTIIILLRNAQVAEFIYSQF